MTPTDLCHAYLDALNTGDLAAVLALFTPDATVVSPLYGVTPASDFYAGLFADTQASDTSLLNVFDNAADDGSVALHFRYTWTLRGGKIVSFECVDVFALSADRQRFEKLTIIYDTAPLRGDFNAVTQS